jgi:hypothetical protein
MLAEGTAVARKPHDGIEYSFSVSNRTYAGVGRADVVEPTFGKTSMGDKLPVYYLPQAPEINCLGSPKELFSKDLLPNILIALLFPTAIVGAIAIRMTARN